MVLRRITALAAAGVLGVTAPAAARVQPGGFDAALTATLERSWSWRGPPGCEPGTGHGRRRLAIRTTRPVRVAPSGGTIAVVGTLTLSGRGTTYVQGQGASCLEQQVLCAPRRTAIAGLVRLTIRRDTIRLSNLRYRVRGGAGCAPDVPAVRTVLPREPMLERIVVRDRERKLRDPRVARVTVRASSQPSSQLAGDVSGRVDAVTRWTLTLTRR